MSSIDENKEKSERDAFNTAMNYAKNNTVHERTKGIMKYLDGEIIERDKNDRPDIITKCHKGRKEKVVGIEIFKVDKCSNIKKNSVISKSKENISHINKLRLNINKQKEHNQIVDNEKYKKLLSSIFTLAQEELNSSYSNFISAFKYHFNHHANRINNYLDSVSQYGNHVEIAFFIDIEYSEQNLFYNYNGTVKQVANNEMPFYSDIIKIINSHPNTKYLDYIVFFIHNINYANKQVIAVRTKNIKRNLENQNIILYKYLGSNYINVTNSKVTIDENDDFKLWYDLKENNNMNFEKNIRPIFEKAIMYKRKNQPFVASRLIQHLLFIGDIYPKTKAEMIKYKKKSIEFSRKYPSVKENNVCQDLKP